jgi:hypothetical protein
MGIDWVSWRDRSEWQWGLHEYPVCWRFCLGPLEIVFDKKDKT